LFPQASQKREYGLASAPQDWQWTELVSVNSSACCERFPLKFSADGVEVESSKARFLSNPHVLQNSQPLRQEVPQW
jgi:hypothetical protein